MAKAKKLPSGTWRCLVFDRTDADGKRHYESFTASTKKEAEYLAAEFALKKKRTADRTSMLLREAVEEYISAAEPSLSPTTIQGYRKIAAHSFQDIMDAPLKKLTPEILQRSVNAEIRRAPQQGSARKTLSPKTVRNNYGFLCSVLAKYCPQLDRTVKLPAAETRIKELPKPEDLLLALRGTDIELPCLLAMWLSFSMSEIRGLTRSLSLREPGYISVQEVVVDAGADAPIRKKQAKTFTRIRRHRIPPYIQSLIDKADPAEDALVPMSRTVLYERYSKLLRDNGLPHMTFHDLRHMNASIMAMLRIPEKYALERGGWKTPGVMKKVYTHTFSEERQSVDDQIDAYFAGILGQPVPADQQKYKAWLLLFGKEDCPASIEAFNLFLKDATQNAT